MAGSPGKRGATQAAPRKRVPAAAPEPRGRWDLVRPWLGTALRLLLAGVWIYAGVQKVGDPAAFVRAVRAYQVVPDWLAKGIGYGMPYLEIALGVLLLVGLGTRLVAVVSAALFVVFLIGIIQASARGLRIECGCFGGGGELGAGQSTAYTQEILRDIGLLIAAGFLVLWPVTRYAADDAVRAGGKPDPMAMRVGPRRTKEAQRRLAALMDQRRRESRQRILIASAAVAVVLIAVGFIGIGVQANRVSHQAGPVATPAIATSGGGIVYGRASAKVTVDLYEDFLCPICKQFEKSAGATIQKAARDGSAKFVFHTIAILDDSTKPSGYSTRAAAAAACMPSAASWKKLHNLLYANQPAEGSAGLTNRRLIQLGKQAGASGASFSQCVNSQRYKGWVSKITDAASKANVTGTPTVRIDGQDVQGPGGSVPDGATLEKAIRSGHGTGARGGSSTWWVVIVIVVVAIVVVAVVGWPRRRTNQARR